MPICQVCDGNDFQLCDGFYYCVICNTQSQDIQEEIRDDESSFSCPSSSLIVSSNRKRKKSLKKQQNAKDFTRPTSEIFSAVLRLQLEFLVSQGVDRRIKEIVIKLWVRYLQLNELAFCRHCSKNWKPKLCKNPRRVDLLLYRSDGRLPKRKGKKIKRATKAKIDCGDQTSGAESGVESELESLLSQAESDLSYFTSDNETSMSESEISFSESAPLSSPRKNDKLQYSEASISQPKRSKRLPEHMTKMTLYRTVSFCYLGLCLLGEANRYLCCGDFVRWIQQGFFPFRNLIKLLKDQLNINLNSYESYIVRLHYHNTSYLLPTQESIVADSSNLAIFLEVYSDSVGVSSSYLVDKYVVDLNLPDEFATMAKRLLARHKLNTFMLKEVAPLACIVIVLKQFFNLDSTYPSDEVEEDQSSSSNALKKKNFSWIKWVKHTRLKFDLFRRHILDFWSKKPDFMDVENTYNYFKSDFENVQSHPDQREKITYLGNVAEKLKQMSFVEDVATIVVKPKLLFLKSSLQLLQGTFHDLPNILKEDFGNTSLNHVVGRMRDGCKRWTDDEGYWTTHLRSEDYLLRTSKWKEVVPSEFGWVVEICRDFTDISIPNLIKQICKSEAFLLEQ